MNLHYVKKLGCLTGLGTVGSAEVKQFKVPYVVVVMYACGGGHVCMWWWS